MSGLLAPALLLVLCAVVILFTGVRLSRYGDIIGARTGVGGTWIGLLMMASVTSLPEMVTASTAIGVYDLPDIAAGDAIGSCMFNLLILAFLDFRNPVPLSARVHQGHVLTAAFGSVLMGAAALAMLAGARAPVVGWVGVHSLAMLGIYVLGMKTIFRFERARAAAEHTGPGGAGASTPSLRDAVIRYVANAAVLVAAAAVLPATGEMLAARTGLGESFVGSLFIAVSTSLPEIVVSVEAARLGAVDMAAGNIFGSNMFNMAILAAGDALYARGSLLAAVSDVHLVSLTAAMMMSAIAIIGLTYRASRKRYRLSWDALGILAVYVAATVLLRLLG
ncbi:MAG: sodium:calcium antiporter [Acidobacteria bacterium]|nr:sodium:calcium antiporter [Acidobacteriota bacterium]